MASPLARRAPPVTCAASCSQRARTLVSQRTLSRAVRRKPTRRGRGEVDAGVAGPVELGSLRERGLPAAAHPKGARLMARARVEWCSGGRSAVAPATGPGGLEGVGSWVPPDWGRRWLGCPCADEEVGDEGGGRAVATGHGVRVDVERGRHAGVGQPARHGGQRHVPVEHLGRHEMAEIVEPEPPHVCGGPDRDEPLCHPGRPPRHSTVGVGGEDEAVTVDRAGCRSVNRVVVGAEEGQGAGVEFEVVWVLRIREVVGRRSSKM